GEDAKQVVRLGRGQHAGWLIENEDFRSSIERLEDFDALLKSDRQVLDQRIRINVEAIFALKPLKFRPGLRDGPSKQRLTLCTQYDIFEDGEVLHQHEVLVDHAD